ncbi:phytanoyl-CoA dioxygenase family protein [Chitinophaga niabensis]|uniref:Phytanoyl-CoA dioxygenase (PhyH) n=1 Tax=Chitinophaga niabensis TaxID=536979 RepID=A0A1N6JXL5_9BACT|nr:phytanoyl-CoA dioxygenase family protein [Chitinophaga niabensis]SIO49092.1 Phytanoyl-CoA dioxygenase (PhyH) [Chitinophaga niabensis]
MSALIKFSKNLFHLANFSLGYFYYKMKGVTPNRAYMSMRQLFCTTNGKVNGVAASVDNLFKSEYKFTEVQGILGKLTKQDIESISNSIQEKGYHIFPVPLEQDLINKLVEFATHQKSIPRMGEQVPVEYNKENPISPIYDFTNQDLFENQSIQSILVDESLIAVAQQYLGPKPVLDLVAMWWSTANYKGTNLSKAAQLYHFDLDRIKFLKFFIYLSDVDTHNGPHCYIEGSHKLKPKAVRRDGRIMDEELMAVYPKENFKEITGKIGTILAVDTIGFHKGKPLEKNDRLLFQVEFATSMFGQYYPPVQRNSKLTENFLKGVKRFEHTFSGILSK